MISRVAIARQLGKTNLNAGNSPKSFHNNGIRDQFSAT